MSLTRGYTHGLLTFEYPRPLSRLREQYLVHYLESAVVADVIKTKLLVTANLQALPHMAKEANKDCAELYKHYNDLLLPSTEKSATIKEMSKEERIKMRDSLREANKKIKEKLTKSRKLKPTRD